MTNSLQNEYSKRLNRVFTYIEANLNGDLSLITLSEIAHFSPYHFHRIFKTITGETLNTYVVRKRLEKAAAKLIRPENTSISDIALNCGFNDHAVFGRAFKKRFGMSPTQFSKRYQGTYSKIDQTEHKIDQNKEEIDSYLCKMETLKNWFTMNAKIMIRQIPNMEVAYITCMGPKNLGNVYTELLKWANAKRIFDPENTLVITKYHDSFKFTEPEKVRMSACITIDPKTEVEGHIGKSSIKKSEYLSGTFEIEPKDFDKAWISMYRYLNEQGYQKDDSEPLEILYNDFRKHPENKCHVEMLIPIR
ncbi:AraC family transcriptional regulator [Robertkochia solimangrovi]|uniref:AraC family transcriptional regulator n=1 Tax=Robertkochia solimangrovi TaxID=2213046 RepID=UPI0011802B12|nr:helix-turn-helix domain-containing protein [Robertkochia solimangrovi]TRZ43188.1 AraC family transcriptional regulator [Robertkochia solimangrovi]